MITWSQLLLALAMVESSLNPLAIGDGGASVGYLQIQTAVIQDVNTFCGTDYEPDDRFDIEKSRKICFYYLDHWGKVYTKKTGKQPSPKVYAMIWNGGPYAWKKENPDVKKRLALYWSKVKKELYK
jgi:hypothetical protein